MYGPHQSFFEYCAAHWPSHSRDASSATTDSLTNTALELYEADYETTTKWFRVFWLARPDYQYKPKPTELHQLLLAAMFEPSILNLLTSLF